MAARALSVTTPGLKAAARRALPPVAAVVLGPLVVLGAVIHPAPSLLVGTVFAALTGGFVRLLHRAEVSDLPPLPHPAKAAVCAALLPPAVAGTAAVGLLPLGMLAGSLAPTLAVGWWCGSVPDPHHASRQAAAPEASREDPHDFLRTLPVDVLFREWRDLTAAPLSGSPAPGDRDRWRGVLIAELQRRDPAGTSRWLSEDPDVPPDDFVREPGDGTT